MYRDRFPDDVHERWLSAYGLCQLELVRLVTAEPPDDLVEGLSDECDSVADAWCSFDLSHLNKLIDELVDVIGLFTSDEWITPYKHEERIVLSACSRLSGVVSAEKGMEGVLTALLSSRAAVEYMLREDRVDLADYFDSGPHEWCPSADDLPAPWMLEECSYCAHAFPTTASSEDDHFPWCSTQCYEFTME